MSECPWCGAAERSLSHGEACADALAAYRCGTVDYGELHQSFQCNLRVAEARIAELEQAFAPVNDWYESDEHEPRPLAEKIADAVADLQSDRAELLKHKRWEHNREQQAAAMKERVPCGHPAEYAVAENGEYYCWECEWYKQEAELTSLRDEVVRLRRFDGNDDHPENRCERCSGRNVPRWYADSDVWNKVVGDQYSVICPNCLHEMAEALGEAPTAWHISRDGDDPEIDKTRVQLHHAIESGAEHYREAERLRAENERLRADARRWNAIRGNPDVARALMVSFGTFGFSPDDVDRKADQIAAHKETHDAH